jgi:hypothetical protein
MGKANNIYSPIVRLCLVSGVTRRSRTGERTWFTSEPESLTLSMMGPASRNYPSHVLVLSCPMRNGAKNRARLNPQEQQSRMRRSERRSRSSTWLKPTILAMDRRRGWIVTAGSESQILRAFAKHASGNSRTDRGKALHTPHPTWSA